MNNEYVVLVDEEDKEVGTMEKMQAHREGKLHRAVSVIVFNSKKQILTNVGIFVVVFVVLLISVKFATWSAAKWSNVPAQDNLEQKLTGEFDTNNQQASVLETFSSSSAGGELVFSVSSNESDTLREIYLYNPSTKLWLLVYDGYKSLNSIPSEVYRVVLDPIKFTKIRVRTLNDMVDLEREVEVKSGSSIDISLDL